MTILLAGLSVGVLVFWVTDPEFRQAIRATQDRWIR